MEQEEGVMRIKMINGVIKQKLLMILEAEMIILKNHLIL